MNTLRFLIFSILMISLCYSCQQASSPLEQQVDAYFAEQISPNAPGCAIGVVQNGKTLLQKGYGLANLEHQIAFTPESVSDIGSVAKQFTCMAIAILVEQGKVDPKADIRTYLDFVPANLPSITVEDLMHHTSGIREIYNILALLGSQGIKQKDAAALISNSTDLNFKPGDEYMYCNTAYMLLADIVSAAGEEEYESWMKKNIFGPLSMSDTYIMDKRGEVFPKTAESYVKLEEGDYVKVFDNSTAYGQGGMYSTIPDMLMWLNHLAKPSICSEATMEYMISPAVLNNGDTLGYAKGLNVSGHRGLKMIAHSGASAAYRTMLCYFPESELGVIVKTNTTGIDLMGAVDVVLEALGIEMEEKSVPEEREEEEAKEVQAQLALSAYTGTYLSKEYDAVFGLSAEDNTLKMSHFLHGDFSLKAMGDNRFEADGGPMGEVEFVLNQRGVVEGMLVSAGRMRNVRFDRIEQ